jgi:formylmethanofuran dehydrogenase subunit E
MITRGKVPFARICAECEERFIPTGKTETLCSKCYYKKIRRRINIRITNSNKKLTD